MTSEQFPTLHADRTKSFSVDADFTLSRISPPAEYPPTVCIDPYGTTDHPITSASLGKNIHGYTQYKLWRAAKVSFRDKVVLVPINPSSTGGLMESVGSQWPILHWTQEDLRTYIPTDEERSKMSAMLDKQRRRGPRSKNHSHITGLTLSDDEVKKAEVELGRTMLIPLTNPSEGTVSNSGQSSVSHFLLLSGPVDLGGSTEYGESNSRCAFKGKLYNVIEEAPGGNQPTDNEEVENTNAEEVSGTAQSSWRRRFMDKMHFSSKKVKSDI